MLMTEYQHSDQCQYVVITERNGHYPPAVEQPEARARLSLNYRTR